MKNGFSIKTKLFCGIIVPALILIVVSYLDYVHLSALGQAAETILSHNYKSIQAAHQIRHLLGVRENILLSRALEAEARGKTELSVGNRISDLLMVIRNNITEEGENQITKRLLSIYPRYHDRYDALATAAGQSGQWPRRLSAELLNLHAELNANLDELISINEKAMEKAEGETKKIALKARKYSMALLGLAVVFSLVFSYFFAEKISRPLVDLSRSLSGIKRDLPEYPRLAVTGRDEIGFLTSEFNRLFERLQVYDQMNLDKLTAERQKVRQAEKAKVRFIEDLSHQLKTPMTSLSMSIGFLMEKIHDDLDERCARLLETASDDCHRLSVLINELVDISRMDAMLAPRPKELLDVRDLVNRCLKPLLHQAEEKGIELGASFTGTLPAIAIDSFRFPWVITNLVGNAIRYTDRGGRVSLDVERQGERYYFRCQDTGAGIDPQYLPRIFDRYTQFSEREQMGAIGLGLAIVKEIIEQHGGDITVSSQKGRGTIFSFWIPVITEVENEEHSDR